MCNKFLQSIENYSVKSEKNNTAEYISNPKNNLKEAITKAEETGILRLEITFQLHKLRVELTRDLNSKN